MGFSDLAMRHKKPRTLMIGLGALKLERLTAIQVGIDGGIQIFDQSGRVDYVSGETGLSYPRAKGPKTTIQFFDAPGPHATPVAALQKFARIFGVDTNMKTIGRERIAVSTVAEIRNFELKDNAWSATFQPLWVTEFHGVDEQFERIGWHEALLLLSAQGYLTDSPVLFVVDAYLGELRPIARRQVPVFGDHLLPSNMFLAYASADVASESPLNRLLAVCDAVSSERLSLTINAADLDPPALADPSASYRARRHWQVDSHQIALGHQALGDEPSFVCSAANHGSLVSGAASLEDGSPAIGAAPEKRLK